MIRLLVRAGLLALAIAFGTAAFGWWAVPAIGLLWGILGGSGWPMASAAVLGWSGLLICTAIEGPLQLTAAKIGAIMGMPGWALVGATIILGALLGWTSGTAGAAVYRLTRPER